MPSPLLQAGATLDKPSKAAPLHINRFTTGLWTNRNPLREGSVPYLYEKFYSAAKFDSVWDGQNTELTTRLTWARRPGLSVYNNQTFPAINTFYPFRTTDNTTGIETIRVIADTATAVYDATGPSTKTVLFNKGANAGQTSFLGVGNTLYMGDGVETKQWVFINSWLPNTTYATGQNIIDSNGNVQQLTALAISFPGVIQAVEVTGNVCRITWGGNSGQGFANWTATQLAQLPNTTVTFSGFAGANFLNAQSAIVTSVSNYNISTFFNTIRSAIMVFPFTHADYPSTNDIGSVQATSGTGTSAGGAPAWSTQIGHTTTDGTLIWTNKGPSVRDWGFAGPVAAPIVSNVLNIAGTAWAASTYYWPNGNPVILDPNGNIQLLTTDGTTSTVPSFSSTPGATTADGTATWTCIGPGTRSTAHPYDLNQWIAVSVAQSYRTIIGLDPSTKKPIFGTVTVTSLYFFACTAAGSTSSTVTANIPWPSTYGGSVQDGTVTWTNAGYQVKRANSSATSPTATVAGNVANSLAITQVGSIVDNAGSGAGSGFTQIVTIAGKSGSSPPTWKTNGSVEQAGLVTVESGGLSWLNGGPSSAANTGSWVYCYSFEDSVTGHESTASPLSVAIVLQAQSVISISGNGDPRWATDGTDTINIYRSVQGSSVPFRLTSIPAPLGGAPWSYIDASPDPPNPGATLNNLISPDLIGLNAPPPSNLLALAYHLNRVFGVSENEVRYSEVSGSGIGVGADSWAAGNFFIMPATPIVLWPSSSGIFIYTTDSIWLSSGTDSNGNPSSPVIYLDDAGILTPNAFTVNGSIPVIFASDSTSQALDPSSGVQYVSDPIGDRLALFNPALTYVTWHSYGTDRGYYVADGSTGWYRLTPLSPPESGYAWSTKANITGGCKCVQSVETSPGIRSLLIGSASSGPILKRDNSTNADNGTTFLANTVIGSIVLAQPNQAAEILSMTTECTAVGSRPTVGVIFDEIVGPFEDLPSSVPDPPTLPASQSILTDRWYFDELHTASRCRHLMIDVQWEAENQANELLSYSLYGSVKTE